MLRGLCSQEAYRALSDCAAAVMWRSRSPSASEATLTGSDLARAAGWIGCRRGVSDALRISVSCCSGRDSDGHQACGDEASRASAFMRLAFHST
jgi:hypothetical protein